MNKSRRTSESITVFVFGIMSDDTVEKMRKPKEIASKTPIILFS